jgi:hypothetical protein
MEDLRNRMDNFFGAVRRNDGENMEDWDAAYFANRVKFTTENG